jgi:hypothetical protein
MIYKIYVPLELRFVFADEFGNYYESPTEEVVEQPYTASQAISLVRLERNRRLTESDWTQIADAPISEARRLQFQQYRQQLRDITDNFQWNVTKWPVSP